MASPFPFSRIEATLTSAYIILGDCLNVSTESSAVIVSKISTSSCGQVSTKCVVAILMGTSPLCSLAGLAGSEVRASGTYLKSIWRWTVSISKAWP